MTLLFSLILIIEPLHGQQVHAEFPIAQAQLSGDWQFSGFIYERNRLPPPNPELEVIFTFTHDGQHRLRWLHRDTNLSCQRRGTYSVADALLKMSVTWVDPNNSPDCGRDPDMHLGRTTENPVSFLDSEQNELAIRMELNGTPLIYILKRLAPIVPPNWRECGTNCPNLSFIYDLATVDRIARLNSLASD